MSDNEKDNILNLEGDDLDAALMAAIEETEEEEQQAALRGKRRIRSVPSRRV
jgi:hypothetical protein